MSSFNAIGGGPRLGWLYLANSNIDWCQYVDALGVELKKLGIEEITNMVWGIPQSLAFPGIRIMSADETSRGDPVVSFTPPRRRLYYQDGRYRTIPTRYVAVSVNSMLGLYTGEDFRWLWRQRLVKRVNDSIFIFDMDRLTETPFFR